MVQAASGQWEVMRRSRPIEQVLADPATTAATRRGLELTVAARSFAETELGLPASRSYRKYADLGRPYVVWNVVATPEFSVAPRRWCFPVAGCVAYRGYFDESAARAHALQLSIRGDDVSVGGVADLFDARPPARPRVRLDARLARHAAGRHDLPRARARAAIRARATVSSTRRSRAWSRRRACGAGCRRSAATASSHDSRPPPQREAAFAQLLRETRHVSSGCMRPALPDDAEADRKAARVRAARVRVRAARASSGAGESAYDAFFRRAVNNAHLASVATYRDCMPGLRRELERLGSMPAFYERAEALAKLTARERRQPVCGNGDTPNYGEMGTLLINPDSAARRPEGPGVFPGRCRFCRPERLFN